MHSLEIPRSLRWWYGKTRANYQAPFEFFFPFAPVGEKGRMRGQLNLSQYHTNSRRTLWPQKPTFS